MFSNQNPEIDRFLALLRSSITATDLKSENEHSKAQLLIRDHLGLPSEVLYLAKYEKNKDGFSLEPL